MAKLEALSIAELAAAELRGNGDGGSLADASVVTATAVKSFFTQLPAAVAANPEGQQTIHQVMALLEKLDTAAKASGPAEANSGGDSGQRPAEAVQLPPEPEMQVDELLDTMAEAAVDQAGDDEGAAEARRLKVAEVKRRLHAKKGDLEKDIAKVRKAAKR